MKKVDSFLSVKRFAGKNAVPFSVLCVGDRFRFKGSEDVFIKSSDLGWYISSEGQKFRTGTRTAVFPFKNG